MERNKISFKQNHYLQQLVWRSDHKSGKQGFKNNLPQDKSKIKDKSKKKFDNKTSKTHESSPRGSTDSEDVGHSDVKGITNSSHIKFSPNLRSNHAFSNPTYDGVQLDGKQNKISRSY